MTTTTGFPLHNRGVLSEYADFDSRNFSQLVTAVISYVHPKRQYIKVIFKITAKQSDVISSANYGDYYEVPVQVPSADRGGYSQRYRIGTEVLVDRLKIPAVVEIEDDVQYEVEEEVIQLNYAIVGQVENQFKGNFDFLAMEQENNGVNVTVWIGEGMVKVKYLGYFVSNDTPAELSFTVPVDGEYFIYARVASFDALGPSSTGYGCSVVHSELMLVDEVAEGIIFMPIYKLVSEPGKDVNDEDITKITVSDLRFVPVL